MKIRVDLIIEQSQNVILRNFAYRDGISKSEVARKALDEYFEKHGTMPAQATPVQVVASPETTKVEKSEATAP